MMPMVDLKQKLAITMIASQVPAAAASLEGRIVTVMGTAGNRDRTYICIKSDDDNYGWVEVVNGGLVAP